MDEICTPYPLRLGEPDCRDYLRTGRCKYGESCKYNHPLNVERGGGVKPANPGEPLYPVRPGEPPCQYYLKHGTCKFGQACKFDHPTGAPRNRNNLPAGQYVFVTSNGSSTTVAEGTSVQVLPQRPSEPNCIYFLRNGKCKYGATCKFHHPLDALNRGSNACYVAPNCGMVRDRSQSAGTYTEGRASQQMTYSSPQNIAYVQPQRLQPITEQVRPHQPTHILLPDGQIAMILDHQSLQSVTDLSSQERPKFYMSQAEGASLGNLSQSIDQNGNPVVISPMLTSNSGSTFESSVDLAGTNVSYQVRSFHSQSTSPHKSNSGGSLSALGSTDSIQRDYAQHIQLNPQQQVLLTSNVNGSTVHQLPQHLNNSIPVNEANLGALHPEVVRCSVSDPEHLNRQRFFQGNIPTPAAIAEGNHPPSYYWPSKGSLANLHPAEGDASPTLAYPANPYTSQITVKPHPSESSHVGSTTKSTESAPARNDGQTNSAGDVEGLAMMTSSLLTMMEHEVDQSIAPVNQIAYPTNGTSRTHSRPPPGMEGLAMARSHQPAGYYVGQDPNPSNKPPWPPDQDEPPRF